MNELLYSMIFKRKSFHVFKEGMNLSTDTLQEIENVFYNLQPLNSTINTEIKIVSKENTTCKRGEYCILLFSENKENYLQNIGYIGAQLDLWLASQNIGVCWYGAGKINQSYDTALDFVIMLAIQKVTENNFRKNMFQSRRKPLEEIWLGDNYLEVANIVRFSPSACNLQPWLVESTENELNVLKCLSPEKRGIMPAKKVNFYSEIDMGIFLLFLDVCLIHEKIGFEKTLYPSNEQAEKIMVANYKVCR